MTAQTKHRRSLKYIRIAAYLAAQPAETHTIELTLAEIEDLVGEPLPPNARFPSWWRNDERRMHARAWLTAGWLVTDMTSASSRVIFERAKV